MKTSSIQIIQQRSQLLPLLCAIALAGAFSAHAALPPGVSNIRAAQRPGTKLVDIQFDLNPVSGSNVPISILVSSNSGGIWDVPARTFVGDHGASVSPGSNKWVVWNAGADWNGQYTANCRVRVLANDPTQGDMVLIPAGSYQRGDSFDSMFNAPAYSVYVSAFYMDCGEVTGVRWNTVYQWATNHGYAFDHVGANKALDHPVRGVCWYDCVKWCNARSEMEGRLPCYYTNAAQTVVYRTGQTNITNACVNWSANGYRLPTEGEWEKAARGGLIGKRFPWGDRINQGLANYQGAPEAFSYDDGPASYNVTYAVGSQPYTSPTGSFAPNSYGLSDMAGNVLEWCWDWYDSAYYTAGQSDPRGPTDTATYHVFRGGSWSGGADVARCADRRYSSPASAGNNYGFRCVRGY